MTMNGSDSNTPAAASNERMRRMPASTLFLEGHVMRAGAESRLDRQVGVVALGCLGHIEAAHPEAMSSKTAQHILRLAGNGRGIVEGTLPGSPFELRTKAA